MTTPSALIIEDDPDLSDIFAEALGVAGFITEVIRDGQVAMQRVDVITADVIVLDLHLPNVSGEVILERIQGDERFDTTRVVVTTADALMADALREKADFVLVKPISFAQLRDLATRLKPSQ
jgi:two-component system, OmpR family, response regulator VicR